MQIRPNGSIKSGQMALYSEAAQLTFPKKGPPHILRFKLELERAKRKHFVSNLLTTDQFLTSYLKLIGSIFFLIGEKRASSLIAEV